VADCCEVRNGGWIGVSRGVGPTTAHFGPNIQDLIASAELHGRFDVVAIAHRA